MVFPAPTHVEDSPKRIRVLFGGEFIVDTRKAKLVWEQRYYPTYYFPHSELSAEYLQPVSEHSNDGDVYDLIIASKKATGAVTKYTNSSHKHLNGLLKINFNDADAWFEEDQQIYVHPKDPYKRVDILSSSRHIRVEVEGVEVANTHSPKILFETGLPIRSYLPKTDCRLDLLVPSDLTTSCPYKASLTRSMHGSHADDWTLFRETLSITTSKFRLTGWSKTSSGGTKPPTLECSTISGLLAFYDERVDVFVDDEKQERPNTLFWQKGELHFRPTVE
ncbi:hypothetical protein MSAN_00362300 [Mycena sanguinolenta]|uniref:DUF427 domain-containing protein n=1 Tax=Mycena sanguinolenta TaxID=230812 RepID=A0A8H6Z9F5_9AGAR|nr:hypothetical protein MSAN_00362300 [Mycena sanguinolenta]